MSLEDRMLDSDQRALLQEPVAPAGLWGRIAEQAHLMQQTASSQEQPLAPILGGRHRFVGILRFAAAGLLGFVSFFGMEQLLTQGSAEATHVTLSADVPYIVEHLREAVPLVSNPSAYVDSMQLEQPWPEVALATYFNLTESH